MSKETRNWHPEFIKYMNMIVNHPNYKGLPIEKKANGSYKWIAPAKSEIGQKRIEWCKNKAVELNIPIQAGVYADVMLAIHPTKKKVCQTCGKEMSLYYHYPNSNFLKKLNKTFNMDFSECDNINDIWDNLIAAGVQEKDIKNFLIKSGDLSLSYNNSKHEIIEALEYACRKGGKKCLGPGAMSNFPDRYDGFHTYNRCCRSNQDKGRSKENLKSYTKDRRAYEYWSDGNIHAANQFMGSSFFNGISADHIGPISLGFVHDPRYLQPMLSGDNSSKRDRLQSCDIDRIIETESKTGIYPMSWYSKLIWEHIKSNYKLEPNKVPTLYRDALKQNMANYMFVLWTILITCKNKGVDFLTKAFLEPNFHYFDYSYSFNESGEIISSVPRHFTERNANETSRYCRIAFESVLDYNKKENRNKPADLNPLELEHLRAICDNIATDTSINIIKESVENLMTTIQKRIIKSII